MRTSSSPRLRSCPNLIRSIWSSQESETPIRLTKTQILAKRRRRQILTQTTLYVSSFVLTSTWPILFSLWYAIDGRGPPTLLLLLGEILAPFNGVFVTVIAARIYVKTIRKNSDHSYFRAFWIVLQNGLEIPPEYLSSRRRVSTSLPTSTGSRSLRIFRLTIPTKAEKNLNLLKQFSKHHTIYAPPSTFCSSNKNINPLGTFLRPFFDHIFSISSSEAVPLRNGNIYEYALIHIILFKFKGCSNMI